MFLSSVFWVRFNFICECVTIPKASVGRPIPFTQISEVNTVPRGVVVKKRALPDETFFYFLIQNDRLTN